MSRSVALWQRYGFATESPSDPRLWQEAAYALLGSVEFRFRQRYHLPPTDPRFLDATLDEMLIDDWAHALSATYDLAVQKGLRTDKITLDVLLEAVKAQDPDKGLDIALAKSMAKEAGEITESEEPDGESEPFLNMEFPHGRPTN